MEVLEAVIKAAGFPAIAAVVFAVLLVYVLYSYVYAPYQVLKKCGIKGPAPSAFFGNYRLQKKMGVRHFFEFLLKRHGPISGYYLGQQPRVLVADIDALKHIMVKEFDSFVDRPEFPVNMFNLFGLPSGLLISKGDIWRRGRRTLSPTFSAMKMKMKAGFIERRSSVTNLSSENNLPRFRLNAPVALMTTGAFSRNVGKLFSELKLMVPLVRSSCETLVEKLGECAGTDKSVDVFRLYGLFTMETILATAFGRVINLQCGEANQLTQAAAAMFGAIQEDQGLPIDAIMVILSNFPFLSPLFKWIVKRAPQGKGMQVLIETAISMLQARRQNEEETKYKDLLQLMMEAHVEEEEGATVEATEKKLTDKEIVAYSITFLLAGYETTSNTLAYISYLLALNPAVQKQLQTEIAEYFSDNPEESLYEATQKLQYLDMVIQEALRIYPPAPRTLRLCVKKTDVGDITIPVGTVVDIPIILLHTNPDYWPEPQRFDPERFRPEEKEKRPQLCHMPFGWGPRNCIGMRFALLEAKMALIYILRKYTFVQAPDTEVPLQTVLGITMTPKHGVYLKIEPR